MENLKTEFELKRKVIVVEDILACENLNINTVIYPIMELDIDPNSSDDDIQRVMFYKVSNHYIDERVNSYNAFLLIRKFIMCIFIMMLNGNCLTVSEVLGGLNYGKH